MKNETNNAENVFKFKCYDYSHNTHKWGVEYANDADGTDIVDVEWFTNEQQQNQAFNA